MSSFTMQFHETSKISSNIKKYGEGENAFYVNTISVEDGNGEVLELNLFSNQIDTILMPNAVIHEDEDIVSAESEMCTS